MEAHIKILILEDDKNDVGLILNQLTKSDLDFTCALAKDQAGFEHEFKTFSPDIVLSDYNLPSYNAEEAFIFKENANSKIPFIIISGIIGEEKAVDLIKKGVTDYITKDNLRSLPLKIHRALNEAKEKVEKLQAEERLAESRALLAEAQTIAKIGNWERDLKTNESYWCDEVHRMLGIKPGEIKPSRENFFSFLHPDHKKEVIARIENSERTRAPFSGFTRILRKDGSILYTYFNGKFIFNEKGEAIRQIGILQDITETKKLEEDLKMVNKELETFIYRASHDLRGPLSSIIGLINVSKVEISDDSSKKYFRMIEDSAKKLDTTLISLVQSMTLRDMDVGTSEVDIEQLLRETIAQLKFHDGFSHIKITIDNQASGKFRSNRLLLSSVFQNLIQNALKYQNYNSGDAFLKIRIVPEENGIVFTFEDNGIGIENELQHKIFDMYFRGTSSVEGTGLGLYIVKIAIEKLRGRITFTSEKNGGTVFRIFLPSLEKNC